MNQPRPDFEKKTAALSAGAVGQGLTEADL